MHPARFSTCGWLRSAAGVLDQNRVATKNQPFRSGREPRGKPMTNESSPQERRLSKFSNADRGALRHSLAAGDGATQAPRPSTEDDKPLSGLLEHIIRDGAFDQTAQVALAPAGEGLPSKLIEELNASRERASEDKLPDRRVEQEIHAALEASRLLQSCAADGTAEKSDILTLASTLPAPRYSKGSAREHLRHAVGRVGGVAANRVRAFGRASFRLSRQMRPSDWRRRYLVLLSLIHRHIFDRRIEALLFSKTPPLLVYRVTETEAGPQKDFVYQGPIPRKVLDWALSALPSDLKRYAFVDFRADRGRTLLLATRRNFEYAAGYAFEAESREILEMNLAQYPRSYMSCRDVRALRGDRDGVVIPPQPAVLFLPDSISASHLDIILSHISASYRLDPRPLYLIVDNAGPGHGLDQMEIFERAHPPILNRVKAMLFGPAKVAVYRSLEARSGA
jgi:hypothetical protein